MKKRREAEETLSSCLLYGGGNASNTLLLFLFSHSNWLGKNMALKNTDDNQIMEAWRLSSLCTQLTPSSTLPFEKLYFCNENFCRLTPCCPATHHTHWINFSSSSEFLWWPTMCVEQENAFPISSLLLLFLCVINNNQDAQQVILDRHILLPPQTYAHNMKNFPTSLPHTGWRTACPEGRTTDLQKSDTPHTPVLTFEEKTTAASIRKRKDSCC